MSTPQTAGTASQWTTRGLLAWITQAFTRAKLDSPRLCAELLLAHVIGCDRLRLYMEVDRPATVLERETLRDLVGRALKHEPVQYLVGEAWFFGLPFHVDRRVLVPRPSTESIVEQILQHARVEPGFGGRTGTGVTVADICTGSGCVAVSLLKNMPHARCAAVDISPEAVAVAGLNAARHGVADRLDLLTGDLCGPLQDHPAGRDLHYLAANPPYISDAEWEEVPPNVRAFEPTLALRGGVDGLDLVRRLLTEAPPLLRPGGLLLVEIASARAGEVLELARSNAALEGARIENDFQGLPRTLIAHRGG